MANVAVAASTPAESVSLSVTNNGYNGSGFTAGSGQQAQSSSVQVNVIPLAAPAPRILLNGTDITGTTQSVVVGQQIALSTQASNPVAITGNNWTIPGTIVGGYNASSSSGAVVPPTLNGTAATIYWVYAGTNGQPIQQQVQYSYCMINNQCSPTATATISVTGVTSPSLSVQNYGSLTIDTLTGCSAMAGGPYLVYGNVTGPAPGCTGTTSSTPGILFYASGERPFWRQLQVCADYQH